MFDYHKTILIFTGLALAPLLAGCDLLAVREQQQKSEVFCLLRGDVKPEKPEEGDLVVVLLRHKGGAVTAKENWGLVDHFLLEKPGTWFFYANPGTYYLTAFQDTNHDQIFERDEPAIPIDLNKAFRCAAGEAKNNLDLVIPHDGRIPGEGSVDISAMQVRSATEQLNVSLGQSLVIGETATLDNPRFARENASKGLWRPFDFIVEARPGIYFLGPYDPAKTPVLFVHGINSTPLDFSHLIGHLDHSRFQPWVYYYPSGAKLERLGHVLNNIIMQLKAEHGFQRLFVVAHSMGGLVSRSALLENSETAGKRLVPLFVSIASPWNGHRAAQLGVDYAPTAVYSWIDMAPGSQFLTQLYYQAPNSTRRHLPSGLAHHLMFTFLPTESGDGTVSLESQLREEAQQEASRLYGFAQSHTGVLDYPKTSDLLNQILLDALDK